MITLNTTPVLSSDDLNEVIDWAVYVAKSDTDSDGQNILSIALMHGDENGIYIPGEEVVVVERNGKKHNAYADKGEQT